jgi:mono/diheme cytochrome c family protein
VIEELPMSQKFSLNINGGNHEIDADPDMPLLAAAALLFLSANLASAQDTSFGQRLFQDKADCQFCHGIDGDGRGDPRSPGQAADLHKTILNREQLIEVITCGRPGTEMPHFDRFAYEDKSCYGRTAAELGNDTPHDPHSRV